MIILIPLGGIGERFKQNGYKKPKALINVLGKPILYYLIDNLMLQNVDFIYIPYNKEYINFRLEDCLAKDYPNINFMFHPLTDDTEGAAETINIALSKLNCEDKPILCLDGDNFYSTDVIKLWNLENKVFTINDIGNNPIYSYVKINSNNIITDIVEKQQISKYACTGAYGFSSYKQLLKYTQLVIDNTIKQKNEYYTSTVIKEMIKDNISFTMITLDSNNWHCLGTPIQVKQFCNNVPKISSITCSNKIQQMRICFDLDNTLVTFPKKHGDYATVEPIYKNISFLKYLKTFGHTIIIYTARRMSTHKGNIGKIMCDIGKITFETLEKFNIPFDEIYFGKPHADIYIDDLALNCYDNLEKSLGFYMDTISPRDFNNLSDDYINIITKKSNDLSGEIYYYNNIPTKIKDLFPILVSYDEKTNKYFNVERIDGLTLTNLFLSELLPITTLKHIMNAIKRIQCSVELSHGDSDNLNIYENYKNKLELRYNSFDYSIFYNHNYEFNKLYDNLKWYETNNKGKISVLHGDCVMTNIMINKYDKIKFIDMRGKLGNKLTIYGDWLYDWAKLYQSLIGYDKILQDKDISENYETELITTFKEYFCQMHSKEDFENLKMITCSLLFSLIPLHNNDKCFKYYNLMVNSKHLKYELKIY